MNCLSASKPTTTKLRNVKAKIDWRASQFWFVFFVFHWSLFDSLLEWLMLFDFFSLFFFQIKSTKEIRRKHHLGLSLCLCCLTGRPSTEDICWARLLIHRRRDRMTLNLSSFNRTTRKEMSVGSIRVELGRASETSRSVRFLVGTNDHKLVFFVWSMKFDWSMFRWRFHSTRMAPILFEETNVFKFAHSRMKKLMNCCTSKVFIANRQQVFLVDRSNVFPWRSISLTSPVRTTSKICCSDWRRFSSNWSLTNKSRINWSWRSWEPNWARILPWRTRISYATVTRTIVSRRCSIFSATAIRSLDETMLTEYLTRWNCTNQSVNSTKNFFLTWLKKKTFDIYDMLSRRFTCTFLLKDIQPLLIEYFTEIELKIMRVEVIRMTLKKRENCSFKVQCPIERPIQLIGSFASVSVEWDSSASMYFSWPS